MDRQEGFIKKINKLEENEATVKCVWNKSKDLKISKYYNSLIDNYEQDKVYRK